MPRDSTAAVASGFLAEQADPERRQVPLRLVIREQVEVDPETEGGWITQSGKWITDGDVLLDVGGLWDIAEEDFVDDPDDLGVVHSVHPAQVEFVKWFANWLADYVEGIKPDDPDFSALLSGGQRAGKTWAMVLCCVAFCLAVPDSIVWIVCPTEPTWSEIERLLEGPGGLLASSWYERDGEKKEIFRFADGAELVLRSGHDPESLKVGGAHVVAINECQRQKAHVESISRMRVADYGGLVMGAANPPERPIGEWVGDWVAETDNGERAGVHFWFNPYENPHVDHRMFDELAGTMDEKDFEITVLGKFYSIGDVVLYNWDRLTNEKTMESLAKFLWDLAGDVARPLRDITPEFTAKREKREFDRVLGVDVQRDPMASVEHKFFENPLAPMSAGGDAWWKWPITVMTSEVVERGQEEDLVAGWHEQEWNPDRTLLISDASAKWQFSERDPKRVAERKKQVKGRGSWAVFEQGGFKHIRPPDRRMKKNPDVIERCRVTTGRIKTARPNEYGQHFLFALPQCKRTLKAIRGWPNNKRGQPSRDSKHAHLGDCVTYVEHRFFVRRTAKKRGKFKYRAVSTKSARTRDLDRW